MRSLSNSSHESPTPSETLDDNGWFRQRSPAILMKSSRTILRNQNSASDPRHNTVIGSIATAFNFGTTSTGRRGPALLQRRNHSRTGRRGTGVRTSTSAARLKYLYDLMRENQVCELSGWDCGMVTGRC